MKQRSETFIYLLVGAFVGSDLRYLESLIFKTKSGFPLGTLIANISGALLLPFLIHYLQDRFKLPKKIILTLSTGLLGSYTTFSTFTADTYRLFSNSQWFDLAIYLSITMIGGFLAALVGNYWAASRAFSDYVKRRRLK